MLASPSHLVVNISLESPSARADNEAFALLLSVCELFVCVCNSVFLDVMFSVMILYDLLVCVCVCLFACVFYVCIYVCACIWVCMCVSICEHTCALTLFMCFRFGILPLGQGVEGVSESELQDHYDCRFEPLPLQPR